MKIMRMTVCARTVWGVHDGGEAENVVVCVVLCGWGGIHQARSG